MRENSGLILADGLQRVRDNLVTCSKVFTQDVKDCEEHLTTYLRVYEALTIIEQEHATIARVARKHNKRYQTFNQLCLESRAVASSPDGILVRSMLKEMKQAARDWRGLMGSFCELVRALEGSFGDFKAQEDMMIVRLEHLISAAEQDGLGEGWLYLQQTLESAKNLHGLHLDLYNSFEWLSQLSKRDTSSSSVSRKEELDRFRLFLSASGESADKQFYISQYSACSDSPRPVQAAEASEDDDESESFDDSNLKTMEDQAWFDEHRMALQFIRYHDKSFNPISVEYEPFNALEVALELDEFWPGQVLLTNPYCPCSESQQVVQETVFEGLLALMVSPMILHSDSEYVDEHVECHPSDGSLVMNLRGIREARWLIFMQFEAALRLGSMVMVVGEFGCECCHLGQSQVFQLYKEAAQLYGGGCLQRLVLIICKTEL